MTTKSFIEELEGKEVIRGYSHLIAKKHENSFEFQVYKKLDIEQILFKKKKEILDEVNNFNSINTKLTNMSDYIPKYLVEEIIEKHL